MRQRSSFLTLIFLGLIGAVSGYWLDGSWQLPVSSPALTLSQSLTFQFKRQVDSEGKIISKLFVYNCFLSQFNYILQGDEIRFSFVTAGLLSESCPIGPIDNIKKLVLQANYFELSYDKLRLLNLAGVALLQLNRQKIAYRTIMSGAWLLTDEKGVSSSVVAIANHSIKLCNGDIEIQYDMNLINESYPLLFMSTVKMNECSDLTFGNLFIEGMFFTVEENRTQISVFDYTKSRLFRMDKVGEDGKGLGGAGQSSARNGQGISATTTISFGQGAATEQAANSYSQGSTAGQTTSSYSQGTTTGQTTNSYSQGTTTGQTTSSYSQGTTTGQTTNSFSQGTTIGQTTNSNNQGNTAGQSSTFSTKNLSGTTAISGNQGTSAGSINQFTPQVNPSSSSQGSSQGTFQTYPSASNQNNNVTPPQNPGEVVSYLGDPSQTAGNPNLVSNNYQSSTVTQTSTGGSSLQSSSQGYSSTISSQSSSVGGSSQSVQSQSSTVQQQSSNGYQANSAVGSGAQQNNNGSKSSSSQSSSGNSFLDMLQMNNEFSGDFSFSIMPTVNNGNSFSSQSAFQTVSSNKSSSQQQGGSLLQQSTGFSSYGQAFQTQSSSSSTSSSITLSNDKRYTTPIIIQVPLESFVSQAKWVVFWLKGLSYVPTLLQHTYLIFTNDRIILYCPCNTYYTMYKLKGNNLEGINWTGTKNQCQNSQDHFVTDLLFYCKILKQNGQKLAFYYNEQLKMAEFEPFF